MIWEKVLEGGSQVREVRIGAVTLPVSQIPNLSRSKCRCLSALQPFPPHPHPHGATVTGAGARLTDTVYERALAGLIQGASRPWSLDLRGHNFQDKDALVNAIVVGTSLVSLNKLSLTQDRTSLQRDRHGRRRRQSQLSMPLINLNWNF